MVDRSVIRAKIAVIQVRLRELKAHQKVPVERFRKDINVQAIILHHYQVAVQACCDLASHVVADQELGIPGTSAELFEILARKKVVPWSLAERFGKHIGLRNRIVHGYSRLDYADILKTLPSRMRDVSQFLRVMTSYAKL